MSGEHLAKRSFSLNGHRTSIALEHEFWARLERFADQDQTSLAALLSQVDVDRGLHPLASACRLYVLERTEALLEDPA